jgi:hypothetical protein
MGRCIDKGMNGRWMEGQTDGWMEGWEHERMFDISMN